MTLLTICKSLALNVGMPVPTQVIGGSREWREASDFAAKVGNDLARRVDWGALTKAETLTGDGTNKTFTLPEYFSRLVSGICIRAGNSVVRPLSRAEWGSLAETEGVPRYFLLQDNNISFWPYLADTETVSVTYQSKAWCSNGTDDWELDSDTSLIDENLMEKGLIVYWRVQKGMPYADEEAQYEAALEQIAQFDDRSRL